MEHEVRGRAWRRISTGVAKISAEALNPSKMVAKRDKDLELYNRMITCQDPNCESYPSLLHILHGDLLSSFKETHDHMRLCRFFASSEGDPRGVPGGHERRNQVCILSMP